MGISTIRQAYHQRICQEIIRIKRNQKKGDYPNFADGDSKSSVEIAWGIVNRLGCVQNDELLKGQTVGKRFEIITKDFLQNSFQLLQHLRPGDWFYSTENTQISNFNQYEHLAYLTEIIN